MDPGRPNPLNRLKPSSRPANHPWENVILRFQVNEDLHNVTVYVVDRATKKVVRTIPPDEANKLQTGDLVTLLA